MTAETREPMSAAPSLQVTSTALPLLARMANPVRDYPWGSASVLAHLQGREPLGGPEAELWMGAHPSSPSALVTDDGRAVPLHEAVAAAADDLLGAAVVERFGARLPFMLKVLAVAKPLS